MKKKYNVSSSVLIHWPKANVLKCIENRLIKNTIKNYAPSAPSAIKNLCALCGKKNTNMNTIQQFWQHFQKENLALFLLNDLPQEIKEKKVAAFSQVLEEYNKNIGYIIISGKKKATLIITAHGNPYLFKEVELLVYHAPKLERWQITAFLQPEKNLDPYINKTDKPLEYHGITLRISEMYFLPLEIPDKPHELGIKVLLKNHIIYKDNPRLREAIYVIIEHLIGEKSFANDIAFIEIGQLQANIENIIELYQLKSYIDLEINS